MVMVSQFMVELQGLKAVDGEEPPKILHLNPRLKGDWSKRPVIEHNTCYRMQWGKAQRCDGLASNNDDDMLGMIICKLCHSTVGMKVHKYMRTQLSCAEKIKKKHNKRRFFYYT